MPLPSFPGLAPLADISVLYAAIMASPAFRNLVTLPAPGSGYAAKIPTGVTCGEVIAAIYDLLEDTPFAPFAPDIVRVVLTHATSRPRLQRGAH